MQIGDLAIEIALGMGAKIAAKIAVKIANVNGVKLGKFGRDFD